MNEAKQRGGIIGPLILIAIGTILLLNNLNLTDIDLIELGLKIWPALLIAIGLDLLIPRQTIWGTLFAIVLIAGVLLGSLWLFNSVQTKSAQTTLIRHPLVEARQAQIDLDPGVGELRITASSEGQLLISGTVNSPFPIEPKTEMKAEGEEISYRLESPSDRFGLLELRLSHHRWDLQLIDRIPIQLNADIGLGSLLLDLRQLELHSLDTHFGIGRASIQLPAGHPVRARIDGGIGEIDIMLPSDTDAEIQLDRGITSLTLPPGFRQQGDLILSPGIEEGEAEISIALDLGIGSIRIRQGE